MSEREREMSEGVDIPQVELRHLDSLVAYEKNARTHSPAQVEQLAGLMLEFGWTVSVLADDRGLVAGHGRCMAARHLYSAGKQIAFPNGALIPVGYVPVVNCEGWSPAQRKAYILADNRSAQSAGWDEELLREELQSLQNMDYDLSLTAFEEDEIAHLLAEDIDPGLDVDPNAAPEAPEEPYSVPGDVWVCGPHRVSCGDSTSIEDWQRLMAGERADLAWTDPPYNVDLGRKNRLMDKTLGGKRNATGAIANDKMSEEDFATLIAGAYEAMFTALKAGSPIYVAHSDKAGLLFRRLFEEAGFHFSQMLIWNKNMHVLGMADHLPKHEPIIYGWKPGSAHRWHGGRKEKTVFEIGEGGPITDLGDGRYEIRVGDSVMIVSGQATVSEGTSGVFNVPKPSVSGLHASQKPVELIERQLKNSGRQNDIVIDAFGGSGSTMIAADRLGMCSRLMELNPKFVDVIVLRWQAFTGRRAVNERTGEPFPEAGSPRPEEVIEVAPGTTPDGGFF